MTATVECGYCGAVASLDGASAPFVACPNCGWMIDTAAAAPTAPGAEPESEPLAFPPAYAPVVTSAPDSSEPYLAPALRTDALEPAWLAVRDGLFLTQAANFLGLLLLLALVAADVYGTLFAGRRPGAGVAVWQWAFLIGFVAVTLFHTKGQFDCGLAPASHGGGLATAASALCALAAVAFGCLFLMGHELAGALIAGFLILFSWCLWLLFLCQLGAVLRDRELAAAATWYATWCGVGFLVTTVFLSVGMWGALKAGDRLEALFWRLGINAISLALTGGYHALLGVAVKAVVRRAPLAPGVKERLAERSEGGS